MNSYEVMVKFYELEILRLLALLTANNDSVKEMTAQTLARLCTTCFGKENDGVGECFETSLIVLRFLAATTPYETSWIKEPLTNYHKHYKVNTDIGSGITCCAYLKCLFESLNRNSCVEKRTVRAAKQQLLYENSKCHN